MPPGEAERVLEPFHRPKGRGDDKVGWGLGLAVVRQIARRHGREVRLGTPEGGGAGLAVELAGEAGRGVKDG